MVYTTTAISFFGVEFPPTVTPLVTLLTFFFALFHSTDRFGWKRSLLLLGLTFTISLLFECIGVATGKVYGPYHYTDLLGPKFLGLVPLLIPAAWFMMMYPSFVISTRVIPEQWEGRTRLVGTAAVGALVMTAWDLVMDPLMVAGGHWVWEVEGAYFGVPLQNYWGWWLTTFVTFLLFLVLGGATLSKPDPHSAWFRPAGGCQLSYHRAEQYHFRHRGWHGRSWAGRAVRHAALGADKLEKQVSRIQVLCR